PRVEKALSGAGWEASGSESVRARQQINRHFEGLGAYSLIVVVHSPTAKVGDPNVDATVAAVERRLGADPAVGALGPPPPGTTLGRASGRESGWVSVGGVTVAARSA